MEIISDKVFGEERALYHLTDATVKNCRFEGRRDGESALKEARNVDVLSCVFRLRYPLWHTDSFRLRDSEMTDTCRAPLWYSKNGVISGCALGGVKTLRECENIRLENSTVHSVEFGWNCRSVEIENCAASSEYFLMRCRDVKIRNLTMSGKYSFQYVENMTVENASLDTKDAFWHARNVTVKNSVINGEYLGWYSENLTLENCEITGTQPLCYCRSLRLINCRMKKADLAFEYSDVTAEVEGRIDSVKNPLSGSVTAGKIGKIILDSPVYECRCEIRQTEEKKGRRR